MTDYISREVAFKEFIDFVRDSNNSDFVDAPTWNDAVSLIGSLPAADVVEMKWVSAKTPPDSERNIFICHGNPGFKSVCIGHYEHNMERYYEDKNWFASPVYDVMYWCEMPRVPEMDGGDHDADG